ncbi:hypothetical protein ACN28G_06830 [Micromonospora sp. WMMA1923]|uniref:hypothetical protein n=1 Tax=Micromonospora sp. WMMA1923 TaxID=3404125 RepID=UPI003B92B270
MGAGRRLGAALAITLATFTVSLAGGAPALAAARPLAQPADPLPGDPLPVDPQPGDPQPGGPPQPAPPAPPHPDNIFVQVSPAVVQPGYLVGIRASCRDNSVPATVWSDAFGKVTVHPQYGYLTASPMVATRTRPGNYRVKLECRSGATATTTLQVTKHYPPTYPPTRPPTHRPSHGPATGFGGAAGGGPGDLLVPGGLALTLAGAVAGVLAARRPRDGHGGGGPS